MWVFETNGSTSLLVLGSGLQLNAQVSGPGQLSFWVEDGVTGDAFLDATTESGSYSWVHVTAVLLSGRGSQLQVRVGHVGPPAQHARPPELRVRAVDLKLMRLPGR